MNYNEVLQELRSKRNAESVRGMAKFGINTAKAYGVSIPKLRKLAKQIGRNHELALKLWSSEIHEARLLAGFIDEPSKVTEKQLEEWVKSFDSWDICDQVCSNLFDQTIFSYSKAFEWSKRQEEFVKRAGFVMMAALSVHDKRAKDKDFEEFLPVIKREANDDRNYVKKAVNWALRQIGKRDARLNRSAIDTAHEIEKMDSSAAKWIASDALRELTKKTFN